MGLFLLCSIRYIIEVMFKLFGPKNPEQIAKVLTEKIADESFNFFKTAKFREPLDFENLEQVEQDRIFNELIASGLSLAILMFETMQSLCNKGIGKGFYEELNTELHSRYGNWLKELGTPRDLATMWKDLINMRTNEYRKNFQEHRNELMKDWKKNPWVFVVAIGCHNHIRRGKGKPQDPLFILILRWIVNLSELMVKTVIKSV